MNFLSIFDVIGPNMIGPSSSHTAGAVSIALMARKMFPEDIKKVRDEKGNRWNACANPSL